MVIVQMTSNANKGAFLGGNRHYLIDNLRISNVNIGMRQGQDEAVIVL
jgi:hypothetical protein